MLPGTHLLKSLLRRRAAAQRHGCRTTSPGDPTTKAVMMERLEALHRYDRDVEQWLASQWAQHEGARPTQRIPVDTLLAAFDAHYADAEQTEVAKAVRFLLLCIHTRRLRQRSQ